MGRVEQGGGEGSGSTVYRELRWGVTGEKEGGGSLMSEPRNKFPLWYINMLSRASSTGKNVGKDEPAGVVVYSESMMARTVCDSSARPKGLPM